MAVKTSIRLRAKEAQSHIMKAFKRIAALKKKTSGRPAHQKETKQQKQQDVQQDEPERSATVTRQQAEGSTPPIETPDIMTALRITMTVRFESPMDYSFSRAYDASPVFEDTDQVCGGLKEHLDHWTGELITRHDLAAAEPLGGSPLRMKDARFHVIYRIDRRGQPWAEQRFASFQKPLMSMDKAHDFIIEADRMIARYVQHHDPEFEWVLPDFIDEDPMRHTMSKANVNHPHPLCCVPTYMDEPGYSVDVCLRTRDRGHSRNWEISFGSSQVTPLTLDVAEGLMSDVSQIIRHAVDEQESAFLAGHINCSGQEGTMGCRHYKADAFALEFQVRNSLGPEYKHLTTQLRTYRVLFPRHDDDRWDCFVQHLKTRIEGAVDQADRFLEKSNDLKIQIHELRSPDWQIQEPLTFILDGSGCASRDSIAKIVQRLPVGIKHELSGHEVHAVITAHKRGHLLLDSVICGEVLTGEGVNLGIESLESGYLLREKLLKRIRGDLAMVLRDTVGFPRKYPLASLRIFAPEPITTSPGTQQQTASYTPHGSPAEAMSRVSRKHRSDNLSSPIKRGCMQNGLDDENAPSSGEDSQKKLSHHTIPSLADTASINLPEGAVTPDTTPEWDLKWMSGALGMANHSSHNPTTVETTHDESTMMHHQDHRGEATEVLIANLAVAETGEISIENDARLAHDSIENLSWSEDSTEDSLALALLGPKHTRGRGCESSEKPMAGLRAPPRDHQQSAPVSSVTTLYNMPNEQIGDKSLSIATLENVDKSLSTSVDSKTDRPKSRVTSKIPRFYPRTVSPQLVSASSTFVNVPGHIPRRQITSTSEIGLGLSRQISAGIRMVDSTVRQPLGTPQYEHGPQTDYFASGTESPRSLDSFDRASDIF